MLLRELLTERYGDVHLSRGQQIELGAEVLQKPLPCETLANSCLPERIAWLEPGDIEPPDGVWTATLLDVGSHFNTEDISALRRRTLGTDPVGKSSVVSLAPGTGLLVSANREGTEDRDDHDHPDHGVQDRVVERPSRRIGCTGRYVAEQPT